MAAGAGSIALASCGGDYYFSGILSETIPNRLYLHSGKTDRLGNSVVTSLMPTIRERLAARSISANYFYHDVPFTALYGPRHVGPSQTIDQFHARAAAGTLPAVSMVDPRFGGGDRKNIQTSPDGDAGLPGGHFHDVWLKAQANGFFR